MSLVQPTTHKKVVVRHRSQGLLLGFADPRQLSGPGPWNLLTRAGQAVELAPELVQVVYFVPDFEAGEAWPTLSAPARGGAKQPGLWVRVQLQDRHCLDGILASELLELQSGAWLTPLWAESRWQRAFVPRSAMQQISPVEMIRPPRRRRASTHQQIGLFPPEAAAPGPRSAREAS